MFSQIQYDSFASVYYSFKNKRHTPGKIKIFITSITLMFTNTKPMEKMSSVYTLQTITEWDTWMINSNLYKITINPYPWLKDSSANSLMNNQLQV